VGVTIRAIRAIELKGIKAGDEFKVTGAYCEVYFVRLRSGGIVGVPTDAFEVVEEDDARE